MRGGARVRSGPPPDPLAVRRARRAAGDWTMLPREGRTAPAPEWPLIEPRDREMELWDLLWSKPQAVAWEAFHLELEVALYVRRFVEAEKPDSPTGVGTLVRQMADSLGLTTPGMRSNRWQVEDPDPEPRQTAGPQRPSARDRVRVIASEHLDDPA